MEQAGGRPLTERESDCMRFLADGLRQDAIADVMGIARVTVEMHLRSARQKLRARTLTEAVAKSILFDQLGAHLGQAALVRPERYLSRFLAAASADAPLSASFAT
jgi:DNA-binding CsgD family transcriptional regulator